MAKDVVKVPAAVAKQQKLVAQMTPELKKVFDRIQKGWIAASKADVMTRYDWGTMIAKIRNTPRTEVYGEGAVKQLAEALGADTRNLYQYADIASAWTRDEVTGIIERATNSGMTIGFSHFRSLAAIGEEKLRNQCTERCLKEAMTVKDLDTMIKDKLDARKDRDEPASNRRVTTVLKQFIKSAQAMVGKQGEYDSKLFDALDDVGAEAIDDGFLDTVSVARELVEDLEKLADTAQRRLAVAEQRAMTVLRSKEEAARKKGIKASDEEEEEFDEEELEEELEEDEVEDEDEDTDEEVDEDEDEDTDEDEDEEDSDEEDLDDEEDEDEEEEELEDELEDYVPTRRVVRK